MKQSPDGKMKMKKLKKLVMEAVKQSGITEDESQLSEKLERKVRVVRSHFSILLECKATSKHLFLAFLLQINSSSRFAVDSKYVRLVASD